jgi:site-specific recombinase XerD
MNNQKISTTQPSFSSLVQAFFTEYLTQQRAMSSCTVAAYRDTFVLFLNFIQAYLGRSPDSTKLIDITPELILAFLDHLEQVRHNSVRSRNARLAALRAFLKYAEHRDVSSLLIIERALGVPMKRFEQPMLGYLSREEMLLVIGNPGSTWVSQRDHLLLGMLYNTGARVSEIVGVHVADVVLDAAACVYLHGKGRKLRSVPLWRSIVKEIRAWLRLNPQLGSTSALTAQPRRQGNDKGQRGETLGIGSANCRQGQRSIIQSPHLTAYNPTHNGDEPTAIRSRYQCYCTLVRARKPNYHPSLRGSRSCHEGSGTSQTSGARHQYPPLPCPQLIA